MYVVILIVLFAIFAGPSDDSQEVHSGMLQTSGGVHSLFPFKFGITGS